MRRFLVLFAVVILVIGCAVPALAAGLGISPPEVEFEVPADGSSQVEFTAYNFTGELQISLENIPLRVEPTTVSVTEGSKVVLNFYGDESLGSKIYKGKIRFLAMTGGMVAMGIKVIATVTNMVEGETPVLALIEESQPPAPVQPAPTSPAPTQPMPATSGVIVLPAPTPAEQAPPGEALPEGSTAVGEPIPPLLPPAPAPSRTSEWPILPLAGIAAGAAIIITLIVVLLRRPRY